MNITQIEENIRLLFSTPLKEDYIYDILRIYGLPKASITRLQKGNLNLAKTEGDIIWKKKLHYKKEYSKDLHELINTLKGEIRHKERFVIVTDDKDLLAYDTTTDDTLDIALAELPEYFDFFLPWAGIEKTAYQNENPADVKAAEKMAKLFDEIKKDNEVETDDQRHSLNVVLSRILFCLFAEDTGIFDEDVFTNAIGSHTKADGSDLHTFLERLFAILNTPQGKRSKLPAYLRSFPYVNGGLFEHEITAPKFTRRSRQAIIAAGTLQWKDINPDIFGSMFQAVIGADQRGSLGQHYTSVPNIMKVIEPLFLNELREEFASAKGSKDYDKLLARIWNIKIFDPACGSGNFLIIAYKELRKLEIEIFQEMGVALPFSGIELGNFYGIEYDDFAGEIAKLALWLAEHQMNSLFERTFGKTRPTLPLREAGHIVHGNACQLDWEEVCPKVEGDASTEQGRSEIYILGNPPYLGARMQSHEQKEDMAHVFAAYKKYKDLDYIACWFYKGSNYIRNTNAKCAFVSTNSICQGLQVSLLWPKVFDTGNTIQFCHQSFKWQNNAKANAAVVVVIIGLQSTVNKRQPIIYSDGMGRVVKGINAYLTDGGTTIVQRRSKPLSFKYEMSFGNMPNDGGGLILSPQEKKELLESHPEAQPYVKSFVGAAEFIKGQQRFCLWLDDNVVQQAAVIPMIRERIAIARAHRLNSKDKGTNKLASRPHQFRDTNTPEDSQIIVPSVSSERREYVPIGFLDAGSVISNLALVVYDPEPYILALLSSKMHMVWLHNVGGKLETRYRYAKDLVYNTFPFPPISDARKQELTESTFRIIAERERHPERTLAELYDPDKMPDGLREAHRLNDLAVDRCYRSRPFESDEERLEYLFKLYEQMIAEERDREPLFAKEKKGRKKKK